MSTLPILLHSERTIIRIILIYSLVNQCCFIAYLVVQKMLDCFKLLLIFTQIIRLNKIVIPQYGPIVE